ncbi:hypothetical protein H6P81_004493 [Aristolochia fimbriata]|uniref:Rubredoxin-like domain-containing protein n=1 Tax=Aristolochia fimbriata TaxID=158543 RepID=A0AAV7FHM3_ARIFI|nr:hypothetical protein H6P81_004493 [Aristolochia fimbriata]
MASAIARPTFSFHLQNRKLRPITRFSFLHPENSSLQKTFYTRNLSLKSVDVSKEDKPVSDKPDPPQTDEDEEKIDKRRPEEKFAVLNTGIYECRSCGFLYDVAVGDPSYPIAPGLDFQKLPEDWRCPTCGAAKSFFVSKSVEIAGFAQNQQFGLGGNALTSGQKAILIYGTLFLFFVLFLSGYFLQ